MRRKFDYIFEDNVEIGMLGVLKISEFVVTPIFVVKSISTFF